MPTAVVSMKIGGIDGGGGDSGEVTPRLKLRPRENSPRRQKRPRQCLQNTCLGSLTTGRDVKNAAATLKRGARAADNWKGNISAGGVGSQKHSVPPDPRSLQLCPSAAATRRPRTMLEAISHWRGDRDQRSQPAATKVSGVPGVERLFRACQYPESHVTGVRSLNP